MRFWRALKAMGCGVLRDGVYVLPISDSRDLALSELADGIVAADGTAHLVHLTSRDAT